MKKWIVPVLAAVGLGAIVLGGKAAVSGDVVSEMGMPAKWRVTKVAEGWLAEWKRPVTPWVPIGTYGSSEEARLNALEFLAGEGYRAVA